MRLRSLLSFAALAACSSPAKTTPPAPDGGVTADAGSDAGPDAGPVCVIGDDPDLSFTDSNCDGIDGDATKAVFVSTRGDDSGLGTMASPLKTIGAGLGAAQARGLSQLYVAAGVYSESQLRIFR